MAFQGNTRRKIFPLASQTKGTSNPLVFRFSKVGILSAIYLIIKGTIAGTLTAPNALGKASIIRKVEVSVNTGYKLHSFSGPGYHYLIRDHLEHYIDVYPASDARSAVAAAAYDISMLIPIAVNARDEPGLFMLQNEQTEVTLSVEFEADANIATGITTHTCTVTPVLEIFSVPVKKENWPAFNLLHSFIEDQKVVSAAGLAPYDFLRGNAYLQMLAGYGFAVAGADNWSALRVKTGSDVIEDITPATLDMLYARMHGRTRLAGVIPLDWLGSSGLGAYGSIRDTIFSQALSDLKLELTATAAGTLYAIRREFVQVTG